MNLFSYVVEHDTGEVPLLGRNKCHLSGCKKGIENKVEVGDWVVGTVSKKRVDLNHSPDYIVYAMKVTGIVHTNSKRVLVSNQFYYFGKNAIPIQKKFLRGKQKLTKYCRGYKYSMFSNNFKRKFVEWISGGYAVGKHGDPYDNSENKKSCKKRCK